MKLIPLRVPKIRDTPAATKNRSMPLTSPPVVCVTRQEADEKHASIACKSTVYSGSRMRTEGAAAHSSAVEKSAAEKSVRRRSSLRATHRLLPLGFLLEDRLPVARGDVRHVRLLR